MAAGVPIVATHVPGIRDVVRHGSTGLLAPVANWQFNPAVATRLELGLFLVGAILSLFAVAVAFFIRKPDPAPQGGWGGGH